MARCVVVGGNGFLGSHLVDALAAAGHEVTAFDRFSGNEIRFASGSRPVRGDFLNRSDVDDALADQEYVFHFISTTTPASVAHEPRIDLHTNIAATLDLLDRAAAVGAKRVFFASSGGAVYGNQGKSLYGEDDLTQPVSPYGIGKVSIEHYLRYFRVQRGLPSVALRIANPFGPRQNPAVRHGLVSVALGHIRAGEPVPVYGDGSMIRDYLYVEDVARMIVPMVEREPAHDVYNIGSGEGHTVNEVLGAIRDVVGRPFATVEVPGSATFIEHVVLDTSRYRAEFGTPALVTLADGIARTWEDLPEQNADLLNAG